MDTQQGAQPGPQPSGPRRSTTLVVAIAAVIGVLVGAVAVIAFWPSESSAKAVTLQRADQPGDDPFTDSVQTDEVATIEQPAMVAASAVRDDLPRDQGTAVLVATGTAPGLYGGSGDLKVCDPQKLVDFLSEHQDKAKAFAGVLGITPDGIGDYVASLTPVVLMSDTLVMNHGYKGGKATAMTSVLQAGTAVMVDQQGVPRVKCNCGNPLTEPEVLPTGDWDTSGDAWAGYDAARVTGVVAGDAVDELTMCDLVTGTTYTRPVGWEPTGGTPPPDIDGDYTIELRNTYDLMTPLPDGDARDPRICPTATLDGAVLRVRGTRATVTGASGFGADLVGTVGGAPEGSPEWLNQMQRTLNGVVIEMHPEGQDAPIVTFNVVGGGGLAGQLRLSGAQDPSVVVYTCTAGVVATPIGSASASPTTSTTTAATFPPESTPATGARCDRSTIQAALEAASRGRPVLALSIIGCNDRFAAVSYGDGEQDDAALLEWDGSTWVGGACAKYGDPNNILWVPPEVPAELWVPCTVD